VTELIDQLLANNFQPLARSSTPPTGETALSTNPKVHENGT
jgi:hypothetical protein